MHSPIVITGMGIACPLGCGVDTVWRRLCAGESGIGTIEHFDTTSFPVRLAGMVPDRHSDPEAGIDSEALVSAKERRKLDRFTLYALAAAEEALAQSGWQPRTGSERQGTATIVGSGIGGFPTITAAQQTLHERGHRRLSPFTVPAFLANLAAGQLSIRHGFRGPIGCPVTACAAGLQAIGDGMRMIRSGEVEVALVGGAEGCVDPLSLASFHAMKAVSTNDRDPVRASRPFDRDRDGFVMGEGAGILVIETQEHALNRGATPLATIGGYGTSADAHHITAGPDDGAGAAAAIHRALSSAGLAPQDIGYINAHATSTPVGDRAEIAALRHVFGHHLPGIPVSATKSATGHLLGAAGGIEAVFTAMAVREGALPPTLNLDCADSELEDLDLVPGTRRIQPTRHALCNAFGFGGVNASLLASRL
ncbi:beta-ketoacyl-ACP synthase II [Microbulbifer halophilus]|uniref:3-oxoacyl-[acyl-carrier-protein] synthase 2 n=1 Tax=Microbulbifer halophilus TaxID=453963 RepID=A0ABW5E8E2_9GAMM|nr:beta-ketoacyl-ACP synthase II [Microbulbifer halophilus]MCW8125254.1 beta-ketoacyl-ACP synthase II [Microbulbifer halophilus]